jgi:hypothetical protein
MAMKVCYSKAKDEDGIEHSTISFAKVVFILILALLDKLGILMD